MTPKIFLLIGLFASLTATLLTAWLLVGHTARLVDVIGLGGAAMSCGIALVLTIQTMRDK